MALGFIFFVPPIPQSLTYFDFADQRPYLGIPNFGDVTSNVLFFIFGAMGVYRILKSPNLFQNDSDRLPYLVFFIMIFITGAGSSYFHYRVAIDTLFWDRLPISLAFMSLVAAIIGDRCRPGVAAKILGPMLLIGAASVFTWSITEAHGHGDLRFYVLVQYGSMIALLPLLFFFRSRYTGVSGFWLSLGAYVVAKLTELWDKPIFNLLGGAMSGHTIKHVAAGFATYFVLRMVETRKAAKI
jgi:hypothetical protein